ncbi:AAR097Cp [Eremothecium gossypii ATCC 10895]|uniref:AAR097Cp n=1 Tax=Eremothecium gossypii (strain ATCC 10895 / CBS 109.51 / FGSC 9923 / NRRL Y-1056) TaxID=284811 RepID=Q75EI2_EREGS|nr:AAR097Cp [Eremothecium gossypii ATCC 10895]AAS50462.1 AAR097Cp [Eremothecium gossypii ATCC 10895]AEY94748.1 FAAR097Cp [Eremothecium gossypii FDAG1]
MHLRIVFLALLEAAVAAAGVASFVSVKAERYRNGLEIKGAQDLRELVRLGTEQEPVVVVQFGAYRLFSELEKAGAGTQRFLHRLLASDSLNVLNGDEALQPHSSTRVAEFEELPVELPAEVRGGAGSLLLHLKAPDYALDEVDGFLQRCHEQLPSLDNIVLQFPHDILLVAADVQESAARQKKDSVEVTDPEGDSKPKPSDHDKAPDGHKETDELSAIWTEGLLSCLLVSLLLFGILATAVSWILSVEVSYGALEKSTNPLKKTN